MKLRDLIEAEGGEAAVDVGSALQMLHDQNVHDEVIKQHEMLCMKLIKIGADVNVLDGEIEFTLPFFNVTVVLDTQASGFGKVHLTEVEDFVYDLYSGSNGDLHQIPIAQAAGIDWAHFYAGLAAASQLRNFMKKAFKQ